MSKVVNVIADASSLMFFVNGGYVRYEIALPMMVCNMAGRFWEVGWLFCVEAALCVLSFW